MKMCERYLHALSVEELKNIWLASEENQQIHEYSQVYLSSSHLSQNPANSEQI